MKTDQTTRACDQLNAHHSPQQVDLLAGELSTCASVLLEFQHFLKNSRAVCRNVMFKSDKPDLKSEFGFILWNDLNDFPDLVRLTFTVSLKTDSSITSQERKLRSAHKASLSIHPRLSPALLIRVNAYLLCQDVANLRQRQVEEIGLKQARSNPPRIPHNVRRVRTQAV